jgi:phosphoribosylformylglycinamidine cyclo-ligase
VFGDLGLDVDDLMPECGRTVAEELLEPTAIYVRECKQLVRDGVPVSAFVNVTGGSFTNLLRVRAEGVAFHLGTLPEIPPVFRVLQEAGRISDAEMHQVFNLGVGFAIVVPEAHEQAVLAAARGQGKAASRIGRVVADASKRVVVTRPGIDGSLVARSAKGAFEHESSMPRSDR